jgi:hypothetical protein
MAAVSESMAVETAGEILGELETLLRGLSDADLHRAHPDGGHTIAQVVSHIHLAGLTSIAAAERMRYRPSGQHMFREEIGHDAIGGPRRTPPRRRRNGWSASERRWRSASPHFRRRCWRKSSTFRHWE